MSKYLGHLGLLGFIVSILCAGSVWAQASKAIAPDLSAPNKEDRPDVIGALKTARVNFVYPKDGIKVARTFTAKFEVEGLKVVPAGTMDPGSGHFHIIINKPAVKAGEVIPTDTNHIHFGKGETEAVVKLPPGKHTLTLQFADGAHRAYGDSLVQTITVIAK